MFFHTEKHNRKCFSHKDYFYYLRNSWTKLHTAWLCQHLNVPGWYMSGCFAWWHSATTETTTRKWVAGYPGEKWRHFPDAGCCKASRGWNSGLNDWQSEVVDALLTGSAPAFKVKRYCPYKPAVPLWLLPGSMYGSYLSWLLQINLLRFPIYSSCSHFFWVDSS